MKLYRILLTTLFTIAVWLLWWIKYPELLLFQEQNQLFLFTWNYLGERLSVCGGLADYIAEFLTQFNLIPWLGALLLSLVLAAIQLLVWGLSGSKDKDGWYPLSFIPSVLLLIYMGDHDVMLCFPVALLGTLALCKLYKPSIPLALIMIAAGYWLFGPAIFLLALYIPFKDRKWTSLLYIPYALLAVLIFKLTLMVQYPWRQLLLGLDYFRIPLHQPVMEIICAAVTIICPAVIALLPQWGGRWGIAAAAQVAVIGALGAWGISKSFNPGRIEVIVYDQLVRQEKWTELIERADKHQVKTEIACVDLNLALFMTGQMDKMFNYWQAGPQGLIMPRVRDYISNSGSCEVFWRLGFVNEALRYAFDTQESIPNMRKSGRWMTRMAQCQMVNGRYKAASRYVDILRHSLFYRGIALEESNPVYDYLRAVRSKEDYLFYYSEMDKMLGKLYLENNNNKMAAWYYQAWKALSKDEKVQDTPASGAHGN